MGRPKSVLKRLEITVAGNTHSCRFNKKHRIRKGDRRLTIFEGQDKRNYCLTCAARSLDLGIESLRSLRAAVAGDE